MWANLDQIKSLIENVFFCAVLKAQNLDIRTIFIDVILYTWIQTNNCPMGKAIFV